MDIGIDLIASQPVLQTRNIQITLTQQLHVIADLALNHSSSLQVVTAEAYTALLELSLSMAKSCRATLPEADADRTRSP